MAIRSRPESSASGHTCPEIFCGPAASRSTGTCRSDSVRRQQYKDGSEICRCEHHCRTLPPLRRQPSITLRHTTPSPHSAPLYSPFITSGAKSRPRVDRSQATRGCSREPGCPGPPTQISTCGITAYGSFLGVWRKIIRWDTGAGSWVWGASDQHDAESDPALLYGVACGGKAPPSTPE